MNDSTAKNFIWRLAERVGAQTVYLVVSIALARVIDPNDYGIIAIVNVFTLILQVFVDSGLGTALVQERNADDLDFSSVFYFNLMMCIALYTLLFFTAPLIADFYGDPELTAIVRVLGVTILISGFKGIQQAYVARNMLFKRFFFSTLAGTIVSAVVGITMAYKGYGVWALTAQQITNAAIDTAILWITVPWRPKLKFSFGRLRVLLAFGWKLLVTSLIDTVYNNLRNLIIGKVYSTTDLAYYNQGDKITVGIVSNFNTAINSVLLTVMSRSQENRAELKLITRNALRKSTYILAPILIGMMVCAEPIVSLILTDKWLPCVFYLRIICLSYLTMSVQSANINAMYAMGRSDYFLRIELIKKLIGMFVLLESLRFGIRAVAYSMVIISVINQAINIWPTKKLLGYGYLEQIKDWISGVAVSIFMGTCVFLIGRVLPNSTLSLFVQIGAGVMIYIGTSAVLGLEEFDYLISLAKSFVSKK